MATILQLSTPSQDTPCQPLATQAHLSAANVRLQLELKMPSLCIHLILPRLLKTTMNATVFRCRVCKALCSNVLACARHVSPLQEHHWNVMNRIFKVCVASPWRQKMRRRLLSTRPLAPPTQGGCSREKSSPRRWHAASNAPVGAMEGLGHYSKMEISDSSNYKSIEDKIMSPICSWRAMPFPRLISNLRPKFLNEKNSAKRVHQKNKCWYWCPNKNICYHMLLYVAIHNGIPFQLEITQCYNLGFSQGARPAAHAPSVFAPEARWVEAFGWHWDGTSAHIMRSVMHKRI